MNLTIESIFKRDETEQFCRETATGKATVAHFTTTGEADTTRLTD